MIIHISGPSGSGKSTLGGKLKEHFKNKIVVKDLDDLRAELEKI
jgi:uridine kinase